MRRDDILIAESYRKVQLEQLTEGIIRNAYDRFRGLFAKKEDKSSVREKALKILDDAEVNLKKLGLDPDEIPRYFELKSTMAKSTGGIIPTPTKKPTPDEDFAPKPTSVTPTASTPPVTTTPPAASTPPAATTTNPSVTKTTPAVSTPPVSKPTTITPQKNKANTPTNDWSENDPRRNEELNRRQGISEPLPKGLFSDDDDDDSEKEINPEHLIPGHSKDKSGMVSPEIVKVHLGIDRGKPGETILSLLSKAGFLKGSHSKKIKASDVEGDNYVKIQDYLSKYKEEQEKAKSTAATAASNPKKLVRTSKAKPTAATAASKPAKKATTSKAKPTAASKPEKPTKSSKTPPKTPPKKKKGK